MDKGGGGEEGRGRMRLLFVNSTTTTKKEKKQEKQKTKKSTNVDLWDFLGLFVCDFIISSHEKIFDRFFHFSFFAFCKLFPEKKKKEKKKMNCLRSIIFRSLPCRGPQKRLAMTMRECSSSSPSPSPSVQSKVPLVSLIVIGNEVLNGQTKDKNIPTAVFFLSFLYFSFLFFSLLFFSFLFFSFLFFFLFFLFFKF